MVYGLKKRFHMSPLLETHQLVKRFGAMTATASVDLTLEWGEIHAIIGPNGAGKTTLMGQIAGELKPDEGTIFFENQDITSLQPHGRSRRGIARMFQVAHVFPASTVLENVMLAHLSQRGHGFRFWKNARSDRESRLAAMNFLEQVGLENRGEALAGTLSHGEQRQLEVAMVLAGNPKVLLMDEPTAGMGPEETARMIVLLSRIKGRQGLLLVEHDMETVYQLADRVTVMVYGRILASGTVEEIRRDESVRKAYLGDEKEEKEANA